MGCLTRKTVILREYHWIELTDYVQCEHTRLGVIKQGWEVPNYMENFTGQSQKYSPLYTMFDYQQNNGDFQARMNHPDFHGLQHLYPFMANPGMVMMVDPCGLLPGLFINGPWKKHQEHLTSASENQVDPILTRQESRGITPVLGGLYWSIMFYQFYLRKFGCDNHIKKQKGISSLEIQLQCILLPDKLMIPQ